MYRDHHGLSVTAASQQAVDTFDKTVLSYLGFGTDIGTRLKETLTLDPNFVLAHCFKGYLFLLMGSKPLVPRAQKELELAQAHAASVTTREQLHVKALAAWCRLDLAGATLAWEDAARSDPHDVLAVKMLHYTHFYMGDSRNLHRSVDRAMPAWTSGLPAYGYMLSMQAFGLEETGAYDDALNAGLRAFDLNANDAWAVHAVAHVHEMRDDRVPGHAWLSAALKDGGKRWHNFRYHLVWHQALVLHETEAYDRVLALYDTAMFDPASDEYLDLANDTSILLRLEMAGVNVGARWQVLAEKVKSRTDEHLLAFVDAHFMMPLAAVAPDHAQQFLTSIQQYAATNKDTFAAASKAVARDLCAAVRAYQLGQFDACVEILDPARAFVHLIGGSHAQRDVFNEMLIEAAVRAARFDTARALLFERVTYRPRNVRAWNRLAYVLRQVGDVDGAIKATQAAQGARSVI
jgi:tetratricopeptide (TPR) repeat protein